jgi:hypothetical protein
MMDPVNPRCQHLLAAQITSQSDDQRISCVIEEAQPIDVDGRCAYFGRIPTCQSLDGVTMDIFNANCQEDQ